jgi:O-antigen ligase
VIETGCAGLLLISGGGLFLDVLPGHAYDAYWVLFIFTAVSLAWHTISGGALLFMLRLPLLFAVLALAIASIGWSLAPERSVRVALALVGTTLIGVYIGYRFRGPSLLWLLAGSLALLLLINAIVAAAPNGYGTESFDRGYLPITWKGAARHRNTLAAHAALATLLFVAIWLADKRRRLVALAGGGLSVLVLFMAQSMSAVAATALGLAAMLSFSLAKQLRLPSLMVALALALLGVLLGWVAATEPATIALMLGRDPTLTSRTDIWQDAIWLIKSRPLTGYGIGAVWAGFEATPFPQLETMRWSPHAHNGFLQLATEVGLPGSLLATLFYVVTLVVAIGRFIGRATSLALMTIGTVCTAVVLNFSEAWLFAPYELFWMVFVALATATANDTY